MSNRGHFGLLSAVLIVAAVQAQPIVDPGKMSAAPTIDGNVNPEEWSSAGRFQGLVDASNGGPAPESGEFWIGYDAKFIYFAGKLVDTQPNGIVATEYRTNVSVEGNDHLHIYLDVLGTLNSFNEFFVTPTGATNLELSGGRALKREWLGEFISKGRITESGWEVEARIPWQLMQLPSPGPRNLRLQVARYMGRFQRTYGWVYTGGQPQRMGVWKGVEVPKAEFRRTLKLLPYIYGGRDSDGGSIFDGGLDLKTSLTPTIEMVGTVNPDFRNIENSILALDFSYFERLPADVRPFFAEGANYYGSALFASQRIDKFDVGLNTYGQLSDRLSFGMLGTHQDGGIDAYTGGFNYRPGRSDYMRLAFSKLDGEGQRNDAALLRYQKEAGPWILNLRGQFTEDRELGTGSFLDAGYQFQQKGFFSAMFYNRITDDFAPRLGFVPEVDLKGVIYEHFYTKTLPKGPLMEWSVGTYGLDYDHYEGGHYRDETFYIGSLTGRSGLDLDVTYMRADFEGNKDRTFDWSLEFPRGDRYRHWMIGSRTGRIAGEDYTRHMAGIRYMPTTKLQLALNVVRLEHFENATQSILTGVWDLGRDQSINARVVRQDDDTSGYIAYRKSGNRGNEYFLIFGDPNSRTFRGNVILKVVMPFEIR